MTEPRNDGPFESWDSLKPTLEPLLRDAGEYFLPWSTANATALAAGEESFSVTLDGKAYVTEKSRTLAESVARALRRRCRQVRA